MSLRWEEDEEKKQFFSTEKEKEESIHSNIGISNSAEELDSEDEAGDQKCLTLRVLQKLLPCVKNKTVWEHSQEDVFKTQEVEETKYPRILKILESPIFDIIFVGSALLSIFILVFSYGFIVESRLLWALIHSVNSVYTFSVFFHWLQILIKSKYAKTNQGYNLEDVVYSILSVIPLDIIVLVIYVLNDNGDGKNLLAPWINYSRLNYFFRIRNVFVYFSKWDDGLAVGSFKMFLIRTSVCMTFLVHCVACIWHSIACKSFQVSHFRMKPAQATTELCYPASWISELQNYPFPTPLLRHNWSVLLEHYLVSLYWAVITCLRLGANDIKASLVSDYEVCFTVIAQLSSWIFIIVYISGSLTSLFIEFDTEREHFLTRRFGIDRYLDFSNGTVMGKIRNDVNRFYDYLWTKSGGIQNWDMVEEMMPTTMKTQIYYDVNKSILNQLPLLVNLDEAFLMSLSLHMKHCCYLRGEVLRKKDEPMLAMFYIINGYLEILSEDERHSIAEIRNGSVIGEIYLMQSFPGIATIRCGTDCDIMVLKKKDFKNVLNMFPEYVPILNERFEKRLEQSGLLISLCEKHNEYPKAFQRLDQMNSQYETNENDYHNVFGGITNSAKKSERRSVQLGSEDFEGLNIDPNTEKRSMQPTMDTTDNVILNREEATAAAYFALERDVSRAALLAKDLNIPRPPLTVTAPSIYQYQMGKNGDPKMQTKTLAIAVLPNTSENAEMRSEAEVFWKTLVFMSVLSVVFYYPYQFGYGVRNPSQNYLDYVAHLFDVIFCIDFILDMLRIVITPYKTLEAPMEILSYRAKTVYFYLRLVSFLPLEYLIGPAVGLHGGRGGSRYYYILKFNRLIQYYEGIKYYRGFERNSKLAPELLFIAKAGARFLFAVHIFAIIIEVVLMDIEHNRPFERIPELGDPNIRAYDFVFYWAIQVLSGTGYDDIPLRSDAEIVSIVIGLIYGVCLAFILTARACSIFVNAQRRRVAFKQTYYSLMNFMNIKKFSNALSFRVRSYYSLQWRSNDGVLLPHEKCPIWDAPKSLLQSVAVAQAYEYVSRIPLFKYCNEVHITAVCTTLRQYTIPPNEIILYPNDRARDLYIIVKGFCQVTYNDVIIGTLGEGEYFGLPGLIYGTNKPVQIATLTHCKLFCFPFTDFVEFGRKFPTFRNEYKILRGDASFKKSKYIFIDPNEQEIQLPEQNATLPPFEKTSSNALNNKPSAVVVETPSTATMLSLGKPKEKAKFHICRLFLIPKTICPNGHFLKCWTIFRVVAAFIIGNFVAVQISFSVHPTTSLIVVLAFDIIAWIDMYMCFHIGYFGDEMQLVSDRLKTAMHYLKGPFLLDLLACFPLDYIVLLVVPNIHPFRTPFEYGGFYYLVTSCRLNRILQLYRMLVSRRILQKMITRSLPFVTLLQVVPMMLTFLNLATCASIFTVCGASMNGEPVQCKEYAWIIHGLIYQDFPQDLILTNPIISYNRAFYWVMSCAVPVGFGDFDSIIHPTNRKIAAAVIFFGLLVSAYLVGLLSACLVGEDSRRIAIREKTKIMFKFLEQFNVPKDLQRRVKECYFNAWDKIKEIDQNKLFYSLNPTLKLDVMNNVYENSLRKSPLFESLDKSGIQILSSKLTELFFPEGEFVLKYGDLNQDVFFVSKGVIVAYTEMGDVLSYIGAGSLVGEISALFEVQRLYTLVCGTDVELFVLKKEDFLDFLSLYPDLKVTLEKSCLLHYKETMEATAAGAGITVIVPISDEGDYIGADDEPRVESNGSIRKENVKDSKIAEGPEIVIHGSRNNGSSSVVKFSKDDHDTTAELFQDPLRLLVSSDTKDTDKSEKDERSRYWHPRFSYLVTYGKIPRDEMGLLHFLQEKQDCTFRNFVVHPATPICTWFGLYLFLTSLSCGLTAYEIAFYVNGESEGTILLTIRCFLEVFFVIRIFGNFHQGYYDESGVIISDISKIRKRYVCSWNGLWMDLFTTLPFYLLTYITGNIGLGHGVSADIRGMQLLRVFLLSRYLQATETALRMKSSRVNMIKVPILLVFIFHFCTCAWYLIACDGMDCVEGSWMSIVLKKLKDHAKITMYSDVGIGSRYLLSLYYVTTAITFTGLSDITPRTTTEIFGTTCLIFVTVFAIAFFVGEMTQSLTAQVASKIHFQHKLSVLQDHFLTMGLSTSKSNEVREYFRLLWLKCNGISYKTLMNDLPYPLRTDIAMIIYGQNLKNSKFLGKLDENIIRQLSSRIKHQIFMPGAHIIRSGDICTGTFFVKKGEVVILDENSNLELCVEILYENECFGEVKAFLKREPFRFSYIARLETEIGILSGEDLEDVLGRQPGLYEEIVSKATKVRNHRISMKEEEDKIPIRTLSKTSSNAKPSNKAMERASKKL